MSNFHPYHENDATVSSVSKSTNKVTNVSTMNPYCQNQQYETPFDNSPGTLNQEAYQPMGNYTYFQITRFPHPKTKKYGVVKYLFDHQMVIQKIKEYQLNQASLKKVINKLGQHQYRVFPVYSLDQIPRPEAGDFLTAASVNTNSSYDYSGYAPF